MNFFRSSLLQILVILLIFSSCKDTDEYRVDAEFDDYLQRFLTQASLHGRNFDLHHTGLIIEFGQLSENIAGLTHYENPIRIQIDKTYWSQISSSANADLIKEELIFHELGHGLLGRNHLNTTLENGDWKSIMCGGSKVNNRPWNINYKGMRRTYYINELFDKNIGLPDFSSLQLPIDTAGYKKVLFFNFNTADKNNFGWDLTDNSSYTLSMLNGQLFFHSKVSDTYMVLLKTSVDLQTDFSFELSIQYTTKDVDGFYGLVFGSTANVVKATQLPVEYLTVNNNRKMQMGNRSWYTFFTEIPALSVIPGAGNKLKVFKSGTMLYYFVNDTYLYCSEMEIAGPGNQFGFMVPAKGNVLIDNFSISVRNAYQLKSQNSKAVGVSYECIPVKSLTPEAFNQ